MIKNGEKPVIYDLYSGTGTIAQIVAPVAKEVVGIEIVEEAVEAVKINAQLNNLCITVILAGDVLYFSLTMWKLSRTLLFLIHQETV